MKKWQKKKNTMTLNLFDAVCAYFLNYGIFRTVNKNNKFTWAEGIHRNLVYHSVVNVPLNFDVGKVLRTIA